MRSQRFNDRSSVVRPKRIYYENVFKTIYRVLPAFLRPTSPNISLGKSILDASKHAVDVLGFPPSGRTRPVRIYLVILGRRYRPGAFTRCAAPRYQRPELAACRLPSKSWSSSSSRHENHSGGPCGRHRHSFNYARPAYLSVFYPRRPL